MIRIKVKGRWVEYVTEERLELTDDQEKAGIYSWAGSVRAEELVRYHLTMDQHGWCTCKGTNECEGHRC